MTLWKFAPVADPGDDRWLDHRYFDEVVVRAETIGRAIATAALVLGRTEGQMGNETTSERTGLEDPKLYQAARAEPGDLGFAEMATEGPPTVLRARCEGVDVVARAA